MGVLAGGLQDVPGYLTSLYLFGLYPGNLEERPWRPELQLLYALFFSSSGKRRGM